uniref:Secreted protein n=1 Tax=Romanomermis culicivorax TaxID=13658 RepID=A0A915HFA9_ROMCU
MLKGFMGGVVAVPSLANVGVGVTIPTRAQQKWPSSGLVDWLQHQSYGIADCRRLNPRDRRQSPIVANCRQLAATKILGFFTPE